MAAVARRRLEMLGRELALAAGRADPGSDPDPDLDPRPARTEVPVPVVVPFPGRHARARGDRGWSRLAAALEDKVPPAFAARVSLRPSHVVALAVVLLAAVAATAWWTWAATPDAVPVPVARLSPGPEPVATSERSAAAGVPGPATDVVVDVAGKVRRPGVATLPAGSRVIDALKRAGGARHGVDLSTLNLARVLVDGEQILVGVAPVGGAAGAVPPASGSAALVNLNTSTLDQLDALPGVGPVTARKILDWRTDHGRFSTVDELLEVDGIGAKTFAEIAPHVTL